LAHTFVNSAPLLPSYDYAADYGYNAANQLIEAAGTNPEYSYVPLDLATPAVMPLGFAKASNAVVDYLANELNQYTEVDDGTPVLPEYDLNGNLTEFGNQVFTYDSENRLVAYASPSFDSNTTATSSGGG